MATEYTTEDLTAMKTVELRKLAGEMGIRRMSSARKDQLVPAIMTEQELANAFERREGTKKALDQAADEGWSGSLKPAKARAKRTADGTVKGKLCAECGEKPVDHKTQGADSTMCGDCFDLAGLENEHSDGLHDGEPIVGCPDCYSNSSDEISAKALRFEADAKAAGWSALARNGFNGTSLVTATSPDGQTLELHWAGKVYVYDKSKYVASGAKKARKIRNASAARNLLAGS